MKCKIIIPVLGVLLMLTLVYTFIKKTEADTNFALAQTYKFEAEEQKKRTDEAMVLAEWRRQEADLSRMEAEKQKGIAEAMAVKLSSKK
jgi:hypothetical protein